MFNIRGMMSPETVQKKLQTHELTLTLSAA